MLGDAVSYDRIPYFFSDQYDVGMEYSGYAPNWDEVVFRGDRAEGEFVAFWLRDGAVVAGMNVNVWDVNEHVQALIRSRARSTWARSPTPTRRWSRWFRSLLEYPDDEEMWIAPETTYQPLFVQSRGRLRKDLTGYLRTDRSGRKPRRDPTGEGRTPAMISISQRPAEAEDRAVPGHWESDLIVGKGGRSFIGTLVERHTRYVMLTHLANEAGIETVTARIAEQIVRLPEHLDQATFDRVAAQLNGRPRQTLEWMTPAEKMAELLAGTHPVTPP